MLYQKTLYKTYSTLHPAPGIRAEGADVRPIAHAPLAHRAHCHTALPIQRHRKVRTFDSVWTQECVVNKSLRSLHTNRPHSGGGGGHFCGRVARLATRQRLLHLSSHVFLGSDPRICYKQHRLVQTNRRKKFCLKLNRSQFLSVFFFFINLKPRVE